MMKNQNPNPGVIFRPLSDEQYEIERLSYLLKKTEISLAETEEYYHRFLMKLLVMFLIYVAMIIAVIY